MQCLWAHRHWHGPREGRGVTIYGPHGMLVAEDFSNECMVSESLAAEPLDKIHAEGYENMGDLYFLDKDASYTSDENPYFQVCIGVSFPAE